MGYRGTMWIRKYFDSEMETMENVIRGLHELSDEFSIDLNTDPKSGEDKCTIIVECLKQEDIPKVSPHLKERLKQECQATPEIKCVPSGTLPATVFKAKRIVDKRANR
jgi:phenylacetate-CoA ligase